MPPRDAHHQCIRTALIRDGWQITDDPYVISYGERFLFIDLGAVSSRSIVSSVIGAEKDGCTIALEIKEFRGQSAIADLEQAIGQYILYRLLLNQVDSSRDLYLAIVDTTYAEIFSEAIGELVIRDLPLKLVVINAQTQQVSRWIPSRPTGTLSKN